MSLQCIKGLSSYDIPDSYARVADEWLNSQGGQQTRLLNFPIRYNGIIFIKKSILQICYRTTIIYSTFAHEQHFEV